MTDTKIAVDNSVFNKGFLGKLKRVLDTKCVSGETCTREQVCKDIGLDPNLYQGTISALVNSGLVEGYEIKRGPYGGIGKIGEKRPPGSIQHPTRTRKSEMFSQEFLELVTETLDEMTDADPSKFVRRIDVAEKMGMPGSDTENAISLAIHSGKVPGYESKRGVGGGIRREQKVDGEAKPEVVAEAAPVSRPEIFQKKAKKGKEVTAAPVKEQAPASQQAPASVTGNRARIYKGKATKAA